MNRALARLGFARTYVFLDEPTTCRLFSSRGLWPSHRRCTLRLVRNFATDPKSEVLKGLLLCSSVLNQEVHRDSQGPTVWGRGAVKMNAPNITCQCPFYDGWVLQSTELLPHSTLSQSQATHEFSVKSRALRSVDQKPTDFDSDAELRNKSSALRTVSRPKSLEPSPLNRQ